MTNDRVRRLAWPLATPAVLVLAALACAAAPARAQGPAGCTVPPEPGCERLTATAEALVWWTAASPAPLSGIRPVLGSPMAAVALDGGDASLGARTGGRVGLAYRLLDAPRLGLEGEYLLLPEASGRRSTHAAGGWPCADPETACPAVVRLGGRATETIESRLDGIQINAALDASGGAGWRVVAVGGFRFLRLHERYRLDVAYGNGGVGPKTAAPLFAAASDLEATNDFYGGQLGPRGVRRQGRVSIDASILVALGAMRQSPDVDASPGKLGAGLLVGPGDAGTHRRTVRAVVPEFRAGVALDLGAPVALVAGDTALVASNVVRPADEGQRPGRTGLEGSSYWAQGVSVGLGVRV